MTYGKADLETLAARLNVQARVLQEMACLHHCLHARKD